MQRLCSLLALLALAACEPPEPAGPSPFAEGEVSVPASQGALAPRLAVDASGTPLLSWTEPEGDGHALRYAVWADSGWSAPQTADSGPGRFVNWADTPGVVPLSDGRRLAHVLTMHPEGESVYAYDVRVRQSGADGWTEPALLHDDGVAAEHGFVSAVPLADGSAGLVWLDGRNQGSGHGHGGGAMTLRYARLGADGTVSDTAELDARTCDCCPTAAVATPGGLVVAYRDRSEAEIRDIAVVRLVDGAWTTPTIPHPDGWEIAGCPVNGPALAASGDRVALAWFTAADSARVRLAVSEDGGATWGPAVRIDGGAPLGRVGVALLPDGSAAVSWLETVGEAAEVRVRRVASDGTAGAPTAVATVDSGRASGVPHIVAVDDRVMVAWTEPDGTPSIRSAIFAL